MEGFPGVSQKFNLAAMLLHSPCAILLDEPRQTMDPKQPSGQRLAAGVGKGGRFYPAFYAYPEIAQKICQRLIIIDKGSIIAEGSCRITRIIQQPAVESGRNILTPYGGDTYSEFLNTSPKERYVFCPLHAHVKVYKRNPH